ADRDLFERINRRAIQDLAIDAELRAVARAIPAALERIPMEMAAKVRAGRRACMDCACLIAIRRDFFEALPNDRAMTGLDLVKRADLAGRHILGEILDGGDVLADEFAERADSLAFRSVEFLPQLLALHDHA